MLLRLFHKTSRQTKNALIVYIPSPVPVVLPNPVHGFPNNLVNILKTQTRLKVLKLFPVQTIFSSRDIPSPVLK